MHVDEENRVDVRTNDPPPTTPYATVASCGPLRLRRYLPPDGAPDDAPPVLIVYPLVKRPFIVDLIAGRSVVRTLQAQGLSVYLTDWAPPGPQDTALGFDEYVNTFLVAAINEIRQREGVPRVALIGCCCGAVLSAIYAALHPFDVERLVTFATPLEGRPVIGSATAEFLRSFHGNIPAWVLRPLLNGRVPTRFHLAALLARDLGEPEMAQVHFDEPPPLLPAVERWLGSDVPVAGKVFVEMIRNVLGERRLAENRLRVGGVRVDLGRIDCPLLSLSGVRDELVTPRCGALLAELVGSAESRHWMFPSGHLGLMIGSYAHRELWPRVGEWLHGREWSLEHSQFVGKQSQGAP
ncbi:MAG TPA: alpha/beta fold hydrolase [Gammaproteobacteria bacterium]|nr:alpha/beta fold hydrolase [Gammaproteobacteria bacterium]